MRPDAPAPAPQPAAPTQTNGTPPPAAQPPLEPPAPQAAPSDADKRMSELLAQEKRLTQERMKGAAERKAEREALAKEKGEILKMKDEVEAYRKEREDRRRNPAKYLKADYGDDWYNVLSKVQLDGSPPGDLIASELDATKQTLEQKIAEVDAKWQKKFDERESQLKQEQRTAYLRGAVSYIEGQKDKYPLVHAFKLQGQIASVIDAHERESASEDEQGNPIPGKVLTFQEAAEMMESHLRQVHEEASKLIAPKPSPTANPAQAANGRQPEPPRKTLTTQLTGSAGNGQPTKAESESERRRRAIAAGEALAAKLKAERSS